MPETKPETLPFPAQEPPLRLRMRSFYVREAPPNDPDAPSWTWACEDCGENGTSHDPSDFGWQLAGHMKICKG